jgi:uncharacterized protein (TIGR03067 family)
MSTDRTPRRAWQRFLVLAPLTLLLLVNTAPAADTSAEADLKTVQGLWEREEPADSKASYRRATKDIRGNKETLTYYDAGGNIVRRHNVEFAVSRMGDVKVFTYRQMEITDGPEKGTKNPGPVSYVYWANDKYFREVWGFLPGQEAPPVVLYVWKRSGDDRREAGLAAAKESPRPGATLVGRWHAVSSERGGEKDADDQPKRHLVTFTTDTFRIERDGELMMRGKYTVDASKTPATIDMTIEETANRPEHVGKVLRGIVEQSGDDLKWAFSRPGGDDRPTTFATKQGEETMSVVLRREDTK